MNKQKLKNKHRGKFSNIELKTRKLTYVLSCLTKLEKLLCLKDLGRRLVEKEWGSQTTKLEPSLLQETMWLVIGSSTTSNVLVKNGGGPASCRPSIGCGCAIIGGWRTPSGGDELDPGYSCFTVKYGFITEIVVSGPMPMLANLIIKKKILQFEYCKIDKTVKFRFSRIPRCLWSKWKFWIQSGIIDRRKFGKVENRRNGKRRKKKSPEETSDCN